MIVTFARHGESHANILNVFSCVPPGHALTEVGKNQAQELAGLMKTAQVDAIFSSPLLRAVETAEIVGAHLDLPVAIEPALIEFGVGTLEGSGDPDAWLEYYRVREQWAYGFGSERVGGGESANEIIQRMRGFVNRMAATTYSHVLAVSHGGALCCALPSIFTGLDLGHIMRRGLGQTETVEVLVEKDMRACRRWGDEIIRDAS